MVRLIAFLVGLVLAAASLVAAFAPRDAVPEDLTHKYHLEPREASWANDGAFGKFDRAQLQRGYQVYKEVCSACHSMKRVAFRDLTDLGFSAAEVKALAKASEQRSIDDKTGEPSTRKGTPADYLPSPFPNDVAARAANNNALPPDLSLIAKAREEGPRYIYSLLTGFNRKVPADWQVPTGLYYNPYFANLNIAMPPPLAADGQVTYAAGQPKPTINQMAKDVAAFLTWTAEPKMENRKRGGVAVELFLLVLTVLAYLTYRRVWADAKGKPVVRDVA